LECQCPWIIDSGAFDHISGNASLFSSISHPKIPHAITLAHGSVVTSPIAGQISLSLALNLKYVLFVANCPFNLISLSQLCKSLNCSITFDGNSFVIQEHSTRQLIGEGHESRGLYYLGTRLSMSCLGSPSHKLLHDGFDYPHLSKLKRMIRTYQTSSLRMLVMSISLFFSKKNRIKMQLSFL